MPRHADPTSRDALVAAARAEFSRRGLRGARIEDITAHCHLSKGAFYLHFESKEKLFGELVDAFAGELQRSGEKRREAMTKIIEEHGAITQRDVVQNSPRYRRMLEFETREDLRVLEHMWAFRDVAGVLLRGSQGTPFENFIWDMTDREIDRVKESFDQFQCHGACRTDIPAEVFGSMMVGTFVLLAMRMSRMTEKPDLAEWARSLHLLIREGSTPRDLPRPSAARSAR